MFQKGGFLSMLWATLSVTLLGNLLTGNLLTGKGVKLSNITERGVIRAGEGAIKTSQEQSTTIADQDFQCRLIL